MNLGDSRLKLPVWVIGLGCLLAILMFYVGRASSQSNASSTSNFVVSPRPPPKPAQVRERTPASPAPHLGSVAAAIARNTRALDGLHEAQRLFGPRHPDLLSAAIESMLICASVPGLSEWADKDARMGLKPDWEDAQKLWAIDRLQGWCEGFDGRAFYEQLDTSQRRTVSKALEFGSNDSVATAQRVARTSVDYFHLATAGNLLLQQDRLPLREIFHGDPPLENFDLIGNWIHAASLTNCARQLGCGPDSPLTASYCAHAGCTYGVTYQQALSDSMRPRDYQAIVAFRNWMVRQRGR